MRRWLAMTRRSATTVAVDLRCWSAATGTSRPTTAGLVHAAGRPVAAGVPRAPGRHDMLRRLPDARPGHRDHPAAGPPARRRRGDLLLRHRGAAGRGRASTSTSCPASGRWSPSRSATAADLDRLRPLEPGATSPYVAEAVRQLVAELGATPLIGFAGAPFTLASYLIEGGPSKDHARTKALMHGDPALWHDLLGRLAASRPAFLRVQIEAGAARGAVVRLVGRRPVARPTTPSSCCRTRAAVFGALAALASRGSISGSAPASCWT